MLSGELHIWFANWLMGLFKPNVSKGDRQALFTQAVHANAQMTVDRPQLGLRSLEQPWLCRSVQAAQERQAVDFCLQAAAQRRQSSGQLEQEELDFAAIANARVVKGAEAYYRNLYFKGEATTTRIMEAVRHSPSAPLICRASKAMSATLATCWPAPGKEWYGKCR